MSGSPFILCRRFSIILYGGGQVFDWGGEISLVRDGCLHGGCIQSTPWSLEGYLINDLLGVNEMHSNSK